MLLGSNGHLQVPLCERDLFLNPFCKHFVTALLESWRVKTFDRNVRRFRRAVRTANYSFPVFVIKWWKPEAQQTTLLLSGRDVIWCHFWVCSADVEETVWSFRQEEVCVSVYLWMGWSGLSVFTLSNLSISAVLLNLYAKKCVIQPLQWICHCSRAGDGGGLMNNRETAC